VSRGGRKIKANRPPSAGRQRGRAYEQLHWWVVAPDAPARLSRNCGHKHLAVSEAYQCLGQRPGERVYLVRSAEIRG